MSVHPGPRDALEGIRVVECGDFVAPSYATKQLADLGAEVVKIEHPRGGDTARRRGPFAGGVENPDASGLFLYLNTNKRGIAVDLECAPGREILARLSEQADLVLHDVAPAGIKSRGLDADALRAPLRGQGRGDRHGPSGRERERAAEVDRCVQAGEVA